MTLEERTRAMFGDLMFQNAALMTQLEVEQAKVKELEAQLAEKVKATTEDI